MDLLQKVALPHNDNYIAKRQAHDGSMKLNTMLCCSKVIESILQIIPEWGMVKTLKSGKTLGCLRVQLDDQ
jgi:hypothetical protein